MKMTTVKKTFMAPQVLLTLEILLERDLLQGPSSMDAVQATGHEVERHDDYLESEDWY